MIESANQMGAKQAAAASFSENKGLALSVKAFLLIEIVLSGLIIFANASGYAYLSLLSMHQPTDPGAGTAIDSLESTFIKCHSFAYLVCGILFMTWLSKVCKNLPALGVTDAKTKTSTCFLSFIIPVYNFFKPPLIVQELWKASSCENSDWKTARSSWLVWIWWLFFLGSKLYLTILSGISALFEPAKTGLAAIRGLYILSIAGQAASIVAACLAIAVVTSIAKRQLAKHAALAKLR